MDKNQNLFDISGKCVVITGGGGILCSEIAKALAKNGAKVAVWDIKLEAAEKVIDQIKADNGTAIAIKCNALDKNDLRAANQKTISELGPVDILINGAGGNKKEATTSEDLSFFDLPDDAVRFVFDVNLMSAFLTSQVVAKDMAERGCGIILNISSMNAIRPLTNIAAYSAAKAALSNFTQWLAVHMAMNYSKDIRVNAIAPGFFLTEQNHFLLTDEKTGKMTERGKKIIDHTPMSKFGEPDELVGTVLWLISDASKFVTGTIIPVDGGFSAYSGV
jgi:NAD(P)-dependent dehydrogenase (short-subunit alcohol dehydrogenase family)